MPVMRRLLRFASFFSCVLVVLSIVMQHRGRHVMDWLRISTRDRSAVLACAGNSVGAALLDDRGGWIRRRYRQRRRPERGHAPAPVPGFRPALQQSAEEQ